MGRPKEGATKNFAEILQRIRGITHTSGLSDLGRILGIGPSSVKRTLEAERIPDGWMRRLCDKYQIDGVWLLTGQGPKLFTDSSQEDGNTPHNVVESPKPIKEQETELDAKNETIEAQKVAIGSLQDQVVSLKVENALLKGRLKEGTNP